MEGRLGSFSIPRGFLPSVIARRASDGFRARSLPLGHEAIPYPIPNAGLFGPPDESSGLGRSPA